MIHVWDEDDKIYVRVNAILIFKYLNTDIFFIFFKKIMIA